jgi:hypothetical protein
LAGRRGARSVFTPSMAWCRREGRRCKSRAVCQAGLDSMSTYRVEFRHFKA